jgi:hypothetical protein
MLGCQEEIRFVTASAFDDPSAPSPTAAKTKGAPLAGVPVLGVNVLVFTGGFLKPLEKVSEIDVGAVVNPSRMRAWTLSVRVPSANFVVGRMNVYGAAKSVSR